MKILIFLLILLVFPVVLGQENVSKQNISLRAYPLYDYVNINSFNIIEVRVKNLRNYVVNDEIALRTTEGLETQGANVKVQLGPGEELAWRFLVKIKDVDSRTIQSFPIQVYSLGNVTANTRFRASSNSPLYIYGYFPDISSKMLQEAHIELECLPDAVQYVNTTVNVHCTLRNTGNTEMEGLTICVSILGFSQTGNCHATDLFLKDKKVKFRVFLESTGNQQMLFAINSSNFSKKYFLDIGVQDLPKIKIDAAYPIVAGYEDRLVIPIIVNKLSLSEPQNISFLVYRNGRKVKSAISIDRPGLNLDGRELDPGSNKFIITSTYYDLLGRKYNESIEFDIALENLTFFQKLSIYLRNLEWRLFNSDS